MKDIPHHMSQFIKKFQTNSPSDPELDTAFEKEKTQEQIKKQKKAKIRKEKRGKLTPHKTPEEQNKEEQFRIPRMRERSHSTEVKKR
ncbi:MAG: hypothetical protein JW769_03170 [Parachlamydiales bacterium]|nr:hypothetical protein [Parachlamydiales bacterium]